MGCFSETELIAIADVFNMEPEALETVVPERTTAFITGKQSIEGGTIVCCIINFHLNGQDEESINRWVEAIKELDRRSCKE